MGSIANNKFSCNDLLNLKEFELCYESFSKFTDLPLAIVNPEKISEAKLYSKEFNPLCKLIAEVPGCRQNCIKLDSEQIQKAISHERGLCYECHLGMVDITIPIFVDGNHIATIICGQVFPKAHNEISFNALWKKLEQFRLDKELIRKAYYDTPYMPADKIKAAVDMLYYFAQYFCESAHKLKIAKNQEQNSEIKKAKEYILKNYKQPLTLPDVAERVCLSKYHFSRMFKKIEGINFSHYLRQIRLGQAKELLRKTDLSIGEIAHNCGFIDRKHFNKVFKETQQSSPRDFRKKIK
ncbi:MAG TPA: PocR ligand-binding domain-containing protein [Sedimentisphaerales bacterium]|nr:PocR ligand-binding domain-containing protein [Sedimentisphaerales bacterium]